MRTYYEENQQALTEKSQTFRNINSEVLKQRRKTYDQKYREKHPDKIRMAKRVAQASRRAAKLQATVSWADKELIKDMYLEAEYFQMEVDHIVPLQGKNVSGLHWEGNLQLLSAKDNRIKSNKHYA
jgi:5-methylcytosine-specific restriction endonuclease McrA